MFDNTSGRASYSTFYIVQTICIAMSTSPTLRCTFKWVCFQHVLSLCLWLCLTVSQCDVVAPGDLDAEAEDGSVCLVAARSRMVLHFDYHVLYSSSFGTPVLYFRVCTLGESITFITSFSALHCPSLRLSSSHACFGASSHVVAARLQGELVSGATCTA